MTWEDCPLSPAGEWAAAARTPLGRGEGVLNPLAQVPRRSTGYCHMSCHQTGYMIIVIIIMINVTITSYYNGPYNNRGSCDSCPSVKTSLWLGKANRITRNRSYVDGPHEGQHDCEGLTQIIFICIYIYIWRSVLIWLREDFLVKFYCPPYPVLTMTLVRFGKVYMYIYKFAWLAKT